MHHDCFAIQAKVPNKGAVAIDLVIVNFWQCLNVFSGLFEVCTQAFIRIEFRAIAGQVKFFDFFLTLDCWRIHPTMMMTFFFALEGSIKIYLALEIHPFRHLQLAFFSGVTALAFALIILALWTETAHWLLGLLMIINMIAGHGAD